MRALLGEVEKRERVVAGLTEKLQKQFSTVLSLMNTMRALGDVPPELRRKVRETYGTIFALANEVESIREELEESRELLQRLLALVELLKERGARR